MWEAAMWEVTECDPKVFNLRRTRFVPSKLLLKNFEGVVRQSVVRQRVHGELSFSIKISEQEGEV